MDNLDELLDKLSAAVVSVGHKRASAGLLIRKEIAWNYGSLPARESPPDAISFYDC